MNNWQILTRKNFSEFYKLAFEKNFVFRGCYISYSQPVNYTTSRVDMKTVAIKVKFCT